MPKLIAIVGGLIICAGIDLLWQSRLQSSLLGGNLLEISVRRVAPSVAGCAMLASGATILPRQGITASASRLGFRAFPRTPSAGGEPHPDLLSAVAIAREFSLFCRSFTNPASILNRLALA